ncbi:MAG: hypothetical protein JOZ33_17110 [Acidobacteriaceae bacterium]|nr:hypothetical protein [Acidobacteriaceae bacterium]
MQPLIAPATAPTEDIDDVLGRFHAWARVHKTAHKTRETVDGVREISYEEALQASRRRWQGRVSAPSTSTQDEEPATKVSLENDRIAPDTVTLSTNGTPAANSSVAVREPRSPSFGAVLTEAISPDTSSGPLALVWPAAGKTERQVCMSFRVAASEQALIKARAAEARLSVSAYLRQCALEVEKLRAQVHHTLALIEQRSEENSVPPLNRGSGMISPPAEGFFRRLRQRIFGAPASVTHRP